MVGRRRFSTVSFQDFCSAFSYSFVTKRCRSNSNNLDGLNKLLARQLDIEATPL